MTDYPTDRHSCGYSIRYIKWLMQSGAVNEIGPDAFALLVAVVMTEDDIHYQRPPNFFNDQLSRQSGIGSEPALISARKKAIQAGLLLYEKGAKRRPGVYFVSGFTNESLAKAKRILSESLANLAPSIPLPLPLPKEKRPRFEIPSLEEVKSYCIDRRNKVNAEQFRDHYEANGWVQGKGKPIRDWKAAVRTWERNGIKNAKPSSSENIEYLDLDALERQRA